ncbi:unnamed protein product [Clonostachys rosea f. rosea IK726]|uniref:Malate dehydrogenase n=2 Tax=Bionectria ochroleuca TaxID=29856 RepID=A0A0B7K8S2_BIOOC|nr:unnamed protein product [Clonostachys rosea f. rosea IK726]
MTKIALLGAAGQIGTPLSLLCKSSDLFNEISLYDIIHAPGIATDLNHIDTRAKVSGHLAEDGGLQKALQGADLVVVTAGIARKPGMTRDDLFKTNASIIRDLFTEVANTCPQAICCIVTNPVNSTVPVAAEALRQGGAYDPARLFGVTTLDVVRASTFIAHALGGGADPKSFKVPVVGGHSGATILPLYSQAVPKISIDSAKLAQVIHRVQFGGDEIVESKKGAGSATTCMAYAGFRFIKALLQAKGGTPVVEEAYVYLPGIHGGEEIAARLGVDYFAVKVELGPDGATKVFDIGSLSDSEEKLLEVALKDLKANIQAGYAFMGV